MLVSWTLKLSLTHGSPSIDGKRHSIRDFQQTCMSYSARKQNKPRRMHTRCTGHLSGGEACESSFPGLRAQMCSNVWVFLLGFLRWDWQLSRWTLCTLDHLLPHRWALFILQMRARIKWRNGVLHVRVRLQQIAFISTALFGCQSSESSTVVLIFETWFGPGFPWICNCLTLRVGIAWMYYYVHFLLTAFELDLWYLSVV